MKVIIASLLILGIVTNAGGQNGQDLNVKYKPYNESTGIYGNEDYFPVDQVSDDFGPRSLGTTKPYDWHGGIDLNSGLGDDDLGDLILSIQDGTILSISKDSKGIWSIVVKGEQIFGYFHIFNNNAYNETYGIKEGGCFLKKMNSGSYAIIITGDGPVRAIGPEAGVVSIPSVPSPIQVKTNVVQGEGIAPLGKSGIVDGAHLHLTLFPEINGTPLYGDENTLNPLQVIQNSNFPSFNIELLNKNFEPGVSIDYPGVNFNSLLARINVQETISGNPKRYNSVMNIEKVEYLVMG